MKEQMNQNASIDDAAVDPGWRPFFKTVDAATSHALLASTSAATARDDVEVRHFVVPAGRGFYVICHRDEDLMTIRTNGAYKLRRYFAHVLSEAVCVTSAFLWKGDLALLLEYDDFTIEKSTAKPHATGTGFEPLEKIQERTEMERDDYPNLHVNWLKALELGYWCDLYDFPD